MNLRIVLYLPPYAKKKHLKIWYALVLARPDTNRAYHDSCWGGGHDKFLQLWNSALLFVDMHRMDNLSKASSLPDALKWILFLSTRSAYVWHASKAKFNDQPQSW